MKEVLYGKHAVSHAFRAKRRKFFRLFLPKNSESAEAHLVELARQQKIPIVRSAPQQEMSLEVSSYPYVSFDELKNKKFILILDEIQDPQNLGALCRSAHIFGVEGVLIADSHASPVTPAAVHTSVGATEYLEIARVSSIAQCLEQLKEEGFWIYGADAEASKTIFEEKFPSKVVLVIGSEEKGMKRLVRERCDILLKIPSVRGEIGSLNASAAGAILLCEIARQRKI